MTHKPMQPPLVLAPVVAAFLGACGGDAGPGPRVVVEDSAGVRIVRHAGAPDAGPRFAFAPEALYRHGDAPGDREFVRVHTGALLRDGSAVVYDAGSGEVVRLDPDGAFRGVLAPRGQGPGEVSMVTSMVRAGRDSVHVLDLGLSRSSLFVNGALASTTSLLGLRGATSLWPKGIDGAGGFLVATNSFQRGFEEDWLMGHMARYDPEAGAVDTVASYEFAPGESNPAAGVGTVFAAGKQFVYVRSDHPEVVWRGADGTVRQIVRWPLEPRHLAEEHLPAIEATRRDMLRFANPQASAEEVDAWVREGMAGYEEDIGSPIPHFMSPFADAQGAVWLPAYPPGGALEAVPYYTVISPDGNRLAMVDGRPGLRVLDVGWERVLGVVTNEMGVQSVVVHELADAG